MYVYVYFVCDFYVCEEKEKLKVKKIKGDLK